MIPSTKAQFLATSIYDEICPYRRWDDGLHPGMLIAIVHYQRERDLCSDPHETEKSPSSSCDGMINSNSNNRGKLVEAYVHLCVVDSGANAGFNSVPEPCMWESNQIILRFSASSKIPLMANENKSNDDDDTGYDSQSSPDLRDMIHLLQICLGNVQIDDPVCWIKSVQISDAAKERVEHQTRSQKVHNATYCIVQKRKLSNPMTNQNDGTGNDADFLKNVKGFICGISVNNAQADDGRNSLTTTIQSQLTPIPVPLLSISLKRMKNGNGPSRYHPSKDEKAPLQVLLQQCLKRLLIGNVVVCPPSISNDGVSLLSPSSSNMASTSDLCVADIINGSGSGGNRSVISLQAPSLNNAQETYTYEVVDVVPLYKGGRGTIITSRNKRPRIFLILPSTRITLDEEVSGDAEEKGTGKSPIADNDMNKSSIVPSQHIKDKPASLGASCDVILETIRGVIYLSTMLRANHRRDDDDDSMVSAAVHVPRADIPRAFLLTGPPGVGKTHSVRTSVQMSNSNSEIRGGGTTRLISLRGSEILANESEATSELKKYFSEAVEFCNKGPCNVSVIFLDECDALLGDDTMAAAIANILDMMSTCNGDRTIDRGVVGGWKRVIFVAATNRVDAIPSHLRRPGRLDRELCISPPNKQQRYKILSSILESMAGSHDSSIKSDVAGEELSQIAELCVGYVAADLSSLVRKAAFLAMEDGDVGIITGDILRNSMKHVGASALRDSKINAPPTTRWSDIAGDAGGAKTALRRAVEWPIIKKKEFEQLGLKSPRGILMHGPPGCAKTTLARAAAGAAGVAFLSLSPADVYASSYVGEAEAVVRRAFTLARSASPCILFFDEIDSIVASSSSNKSGMDRGSNAEARVMSTFLNEMDGVDGSSDDGVLVLGATNRPSTLDSALLRPGRFDRVIYVPPPDQDGRREIFKSQCRSWGESSASGNIDIDYLSKDEVSGLMTGAEIVGACREAAMRAIRETMESSDSKRIPIVTQRHLQDTLSAVKPLLSDPLVLSEYTSFEEEHTLK